MIMTCFFKLEYKKTHQLLNPSSQTGKYLKPHNKGKPIKHHWSMGWFTVTVVPGYVHYNTTIEMRIVQVTL